MNLPHGRIPNTFELTVIDCGLESSYEAFDLYNQALEIRANGLPKMPKSIGKLILEYLPSAFAGLAGYRGYTPFPTSPSAAEVDRKIHKLERRAFETAPMLFDTQFSDE